MIKLISCDGTNMLDAATCAQIYLATSSACQSCVMDNTCGDVNTGTCDAACGF